MHFTKKKSLVGIYYKNIDTNIDTLKVISGHLTLIGYLG